MGRPPNGSPKPLTQRKVGLIPLFIHRVFIIQTTKNTDGQVSGQSVSFQYLFYLSFRFVYYSFKCSWFMDCKLREHFAIYRDSFQGHAGDKPAISNPQWAACSVDTCDPQSSKLSFLCSAVSIAVHSGLHYSIFGLAERSAPQTSVTFGCLNDFSVPTVGVFASFYSSHRKKLN